ncbi:MAG: hypothetical protein CMK59_12745 [Proteobacteria bacterium]|nr:hypothetical protein [Pseudomonadota bacterium]
MQPLAARIRPTNINEIVGQKHLLSSGTPFLNAINKKSIGSLILWGPPGSGKTTLSLLISSLINRHFVQLSAVHDGMKELRKVIEHKTPLLGNKLIFIDEIHRWNKSQQDALLPLIESGEILLIGATTENPSFSINPALRSRCWIIKMTPLETEDLIELLQRALSHPKGVRLKISTEALNQIALYSSGDGRRALCLLERASFISQDNIFNEENIPLILEDKDLLYDRHAAHYDITSAFIKSMRGSDPDAALYWLAQMLEGGEDPEFIARRMLIFASEDVGNADLRALPLACSTLQSIKMIGMPEARIILGQCCTYLASAPKSNASYKAINSALSFVKKTGSASVPPHLCDPPKGYLYPHDYDFGVVHQEHWPIEIEQPQFYRPKRVGDEKIIAERLKWFAQKKSPPTK